MPVVEALEQKRPQPVRGVWITVAALVTLLLLPIIHTLMPDGLTVGGTQYAAQFVYEPRPIRDTSSGTLTRRATGGGQSIFLFEAWSGPVFYRFVRVGK